MDIQNSWNSVISKLYELTVKSLSYIIYFSAELDKAKISSIAWEVEIETTLRHSNGSL